MRYALIFELLLVAMVGVALSFIVDRSTADTSLLAAVLSGIALLMNLIYNYCFDRIDVYCGRIPTERTPFRRVVHAVGFESILILTSLPILMWWLDLSLWQALILDLGVMFVIVIYTFLFTLAYDKYFPIRQPSFSAQANGQARSKT